MTNLREPVSAARQVLQLLDERVNALDEARVMATGAGRLIALVHCFHSVEVRRRATRSAATVADDSTVQRLIVAGPAAASDADEYDAPRRPDLTVAAATS